MPPGTPVLTRSPLFASLPDEACAQVEARMVIKQFPPHAVIVREGYVADGAHLILTGRVALRRYDQGTRLELSVDELRAGQMFGELALLTGNPASVSAVALDPTSCGVLARADFQRVLHEYPQAALMLSLVLAERIERSDERAGILFMNLSRVQVDPRVLSLLPAALLNQHRVIPVAFCNNRLTLAMTNPNNVVAFDDIRRILRGVLIEPVSIADEDFRRFMSTTYPHATAPEAAAGENGRKSAARDRVALSPATAKAGATPTPAVVAESLQSEAVREFQLSDNRHQIASDSRQELMGASEDAPIVRIVNSILSMAIARNASDIHVESMEDDVMVRFRIDGVLQVIQRLPKRVQLGLISRVKVLARLDISEKRLPQDGRISVLLDGKPVEFRVSTVPGRWGEKICMRILSKSTAALQLDALIAEGPALDTLRTMIRQPYGIIYVTGPTGSGKTTTLYAALSEINDTEIHIATAEDPIEYDLPGLTQIQANPDIGLTFATILRSFLRQDPDVLLVGETRDRETAKTAVEAALTGHLVFTTLHTNSAAAAFTRLSEMGIEPFLVSSSTIGVVAQRLTRRLCSACKEPYVAEPQTCAYFGLPGGTTMYRASGCPACRGLGLQGRVGMYEVLRMTPDLRRMVANNARSEDLHEAAIAAGMIDLKAYAAMLLAKGLTTVEEVMSVVAIQY